MGLLGSLGSLNVLLSADTAQFTSAMDKAAYSAEKNLNKIGIKAKLSLTALTIAFIANTKNALTFADSMRDMAERLGLTSKQMSILAYSAKMSETDVNSLEATMKKMYISAYKGADAFNVLGVKVKDSSGRLRSGYDIFLDVADAFKKMPDGVGKSAAAVEIFGKSGGDIVPLLNAGRQGIAEFGEEAKKLGVIIEEESARNADRFDKFVKRAAEAAKGFGVKTIDFFSDIVMVLKGGVYDWTIAEIKLREETEKSAEGEKNRTQILAEQAIAFEQLAAAAEKKEKLGKEGIKLTESLRTAQEIYNEELIKYNELLDAGAINNETFERGLKKAGDTFTENTQKASKLNDITKDLGFTFVSAFEDAIIEGKKFGEVIVSLAQDIERLLLRRLITERLANALDVGISSFFGGGQSTAITGGVGGQTIQTQQFGTTWSPYASAKGNIFSGNRLIPFANGGLINRPSIFPMANGGVG